MATETVTDTTNVMAPGTVVTPAPPATVEPAKAPAPPPGQSPPLWVDGTPYDVERAKPLMDKLREGEKIAKQEHGVLVGLQKLLGVDKTMPTEPAELQARVAELEAKHAEAIAENRNLRLGTAVDRAVISQGGNAELLTGYLKGMGQLDSLDPAGAGFEKDLSAIVAATLEKFPAFKLNGQTPSVSSVPFPAGSGGATELITRDSLGHMSHADINTAREAGKLEHLGIKA